MKKKLMLPREGHKTGLVFGTKLFPDNPKQIKCQELGTDDGSELIHIKAWFADAGRADGPRCTKHERCGWIDLVLDLQGTVVAQAGPYYSQDEGWKDVLGQLERKGL